MPLKIVEFKVSNMQKVKAIELRPDASDPLVIVGGNNGQGKTSFLDSLLYALAGTRHMPEIPVRNGENVGKMEVDLGDYKITRTVTKEGKHTLKLQKGKGAKVMRPQEILNGLIGEISLDPEEFGRMGPQAQRDLLIKLAGVDTVEIDEEIGGAQVQLTEARSILKSAERQAEAIPDDRDADPNWDLVDISAVQAKLHEIGMVETARSTAQFDLDEADRERRRAQAEIVRLQSVVDVSTGRMEKVQGRVTGFDVKLQEMGDANEMRNRLATAAQQNEQILAARRYAELEESVEDSAKACEELSEQLKALKLRRVKLIEDADMPIDGLGFNDKSVTFDGIPFDQLASSEQLRISMAMAMAMNPELRVIRIMNGALLDDDSMEIVRTMAGEQDFQVLVEVVGNRDDAQVIIEDGMVKS